MIALRLAARDLKRGGRGLALLALCLFLGTAALAGIGSLSAGISAALAAQARQMLGGDVELRVSQRRATVAELAAFAERGQVSEVVSMRAMVDGAGPAAGGTPALAELRGVDDSWPLVGRLRLAPGALRPRPALGEVALAPALAERLAVRVGGRVRLGNARLRVIGLLAEEPDRLGAGFSLGLPAIVDSATLDRTALVQPGSLYDSRYRIALARPESALARPEGAAAIGQQLVRRFPGQGWTARSGRAAAATLTRAIDQLGQFLLLTGLAALVIAGLGVGSGVSAYLAGKERTIATLKVLGAGTATIARMFLAELGLVGGIGIVAGMAVGAAVPGIVAALAGEALPVPPRLALYPWPLLRAAALGLLVAGLFALPALARAAHVPAAALLRGAVGASTLPSRRLLAAMGGILALLVALAVLPAENRTLAAAFVAAAAALIGLLWGLGLLIRRGTARLPRPRRPLLRLGLGNLHRPGAQTERLVVALGLGFALFVGLATIDTSLSAALGGAVPAKAPRFFVTDLPPEDLPRFTAAVRAASPAARIEAVPSLRGSITAFKGVRVADMRNIPERYAWVVRGDRTLTWSRTVPPRNRVVAGRWWSADYRGPPLVSLEDRAADALGLKVGDPITVSVLGVAVPARVAALRRIDWGGLGLNFAIVFSPGYIEEAPHALLASVYSAPGRDGAVARGVADALPSVTAIRVGDVIGRIGEVLGQVAVAVRSAAGVTVAAGIAVLVGAVAASAGARRYDAVVLKLLGATSAQVLAAQLIEWTLLSLILAGVALPVGAGAGWYVVRHVLDLGWAPDWGVVAATLTAATGATLAIGVLGSWPALRARPAAVLRDL